jgi:hypothetical protein
VPKVFDMLEAAHVALKFDADAILCVQAEKGGGGVSFSESTLLSELEEFEGKILVVEDKAIQAKEKKQAREV